MVYVGTSLVAQWLRFPHTPNARGSGSIPGQGTKSHQPQLRFMVHMPQLRILLAITEIWYSQINKYLKEREETALN